MGLPFERRGSRAVEGIQLMKRLWTEENVSHKGRFYQVENLTIGPRPTQSPHPPLGTGGSAKTSLKRAGTIANGYICGSSAIPEFPSVWEKVANYATAAGRDPQEIEKAGLTFISVNDNRAKAIEACADYLKRYYGKVRMDVEKYCALGFPEACAERITSYFSKGLDTVIIGLVTPDLNQLDLLGDKVLPLVKTDG